ncbi:MAG: taurine dioxygenase [Betaproteobacteria bacterium]|nr:taurine dioxygenase [Betaproteobacteria bacterium]
MEIKKIAGALGAEVSGVDLAREFDPATIDAIRRAWLEHCVIFFREQSLTSAQFMALAECFGTPVEYPFVKGLPGFPCITPVVKLEHERANFGGIWHSDTTYLSEPPMGTLLFACELPPVGGDTLFANQYLAYETLSDGLRQTLDGLVAISSSAKADVSKTREDRLKTDGRADAKREYTAEQPVVRTHPETGRRALYVNVAHTAHFKGWSEQESAPLLNFLFQHQTKPEFTCRFNWRAGSIALWDNRCAQHNPVNDYHGFRRVMHRITLAGDRPR